MPAMPADPFHELRNSLEAQHSAYHASVEGWDSLSPQEKQMRQVRGEGRRKV